MKRLVITGLTILLAAGCVDAPEPWKPDAGVDTASDSQASVGDGKGEVRVGDVKASDTATELKVVDVVEVEVVDTFAPSDATDLLSEVTDVTPDVPEDINNADVCQPDCIDMECGDDGCGNSCGECGEGQICVAGSCSGSGCGALSFDGVDDYVEVPHSDKLSMTSDFTLEIWFRAETTTSDRSLLRKGSGAANYFVWLLDDMTLACGMYVTDADENAYYAQGAISIEADVWHHVAMTFSGGSVLVYLDVSIYASSDIPGSIYTNTQPLTFGYGYPGIWSKSHFSGSLSQVRLWSRALSQTEVTDKAQEKLVRNQEDKLIGAWRFAEGQGATAFDSAGTNDGAVHGATWGSAPTDEDCCIPDCDDRDCGDDGCGGTCGICSNGLSCLWGNCVCDSLTPPKAAWEFVKPSIGKEALYGVAATPDGTIVATGETPSNSIDILVVALAPDGQMLWEKDFGGAGADLGLDIESVQGGMIVAGRSTPPGIGNMQGRMLLLDHDGNKVWDALYGGDGSDGFLSVSEHPDGGFIGAGQTTTDTYGDWDFWLVRVDSLGNEIWSNHYGSESIDWPLRDIELTEDGGIVLVGGTEAPGTGDRQLWLGRLDSEGELLWEKSFGENVEDTGYGVEVLMDGGLAIARSAGTDSVLIRTDSEGNTLWQKTYGGVSTDTVRNLSYIPGSGFVLSGHTASFGYGEWDMWALRTDESGDVHWETSYGTPQAEKGMDAVLLPGGELALAGYVTSSEDPDNWNLRVMKTGTECCHPVCESKDCGDDGCGGSCGDCAPWSSCVEGVCSSFALLDESTGLMWENPPASQVMPVPAAKDYCQSLELGSYSDWRLPSIDELRSFIRGCPATEAGGSCPVHDPDHLAESEMNGQCGGCSKSQGPGQPGGCYWPDGVLGVCDWYRSSSFATDSQQQWWYVNFNQASLAADPGENSIYIRCVR